MPRDGDSRLKTERWFSQNFRLTLVVLVAAIALFLVTPLAIIRYVQGFYIVAVTDAFIVVSAVGSAVYAVKRGNAVGAGKVLAVLLTVGFIVISLNLGLGSAFWVFPIILFVFYLSPPALALVLTLLSLSTVGISELSVSSGPVFESNLQLISFLFAGLSAALFSYAFAVSSGIQRSQLVRLATKDPLTNLYNRRALDDDLGAALASRDRYRRGHGMIVLDLDRFKELNDQYGHGEGDRVLREFAMLIESSIRQSDRPYRYGGDEFVILLPDADEAGLRRVADSIVRGTRTDVRSASDVRVSAGAALLGENDDQERWNRRADRNLYAAKEAGGDRVVTDADSLGE